MNQQHYYFVISMNQFVLHIVLFFETGISGFSSPKGLHYRSNKATSVSQKHTEGQATDIQTKITRIQQFFN